MCWNTPPLIFIVYMVSVHAFALFLRFVAFYDYFECYACKEMDFRSLEYDYIVVGSGSAGSIIARRLSEDSDSKVLLIEAGGGSNSLMQIPAVGVMLQKSVFDWQYRTVPQKHACWGLERKESVWPMGKILGGTSMLNNMIYVRGHPEDFASWYRDSCDYDYTKDILPYFEKLEFNGTNKHKCSIMLDDLPFKSNVSDYVTQAGLCMGFEISDGINAAPGFSSPKLTMHKGQRWTTYHQLVKVKKRNLDILTNSLVEKVLFRDNLHAYGVKYWHLDEQYKATASKAVILSAGVVGTPKILMLSGVGPEKHLKKMKITPRLDLPVGDNLQDHITTGLDLVVMDESPNLGVSHMLKTSALFDYFVSSSGPWTTSGCENLAFFNSESKTVPELQFMIFPIGVTNDRGLFLRSLTGIGDALYKNYFEQINSTAWAVLPVVLHPKSRGTVRLKNKNPKTPPVIDPNYLSQQYDMDILLEGIELIKELLETPPMKRLGAKLNRRKFPGCEKYDFDTKTYWECYVRHFTLTSYHPIGTCKLGDVVDFDFQVKGASKLYVVDGSVLPELPSGNPNGAIMMMAERAADIIKHHCWPGQRTCCNDAVDVCNC